MTLSVLLVILMLVCLLAWLMTGFPVAFTLAGTALLFAAIGSWAGVLDTDFLQLFPDRVLGIMSNELLLAVPLFIAMGVMLERTNVAEDLLGSMSRLFGRRRGGLGFSVTVVGALLAASTGIVGATVVTMGLLSLPVMLKRGYDPKLATGAIAAAGTLGQIIPPSIVLILLTDALSNAWSEVQRDQGVLAPDPLSVGELFSGALLPGILLVGLYLLYQATMAILRPDSSPAVVDEDDVLDRAFYLGLLRALAPPIILIVAVLGSILGGVATPTEAAAVGAVGSILLGAGRADPRLQRFGDIGLVLLGLLFVFAISGAALSAGPLRLLAGVMALALALILGRILLGLHGKRILLPVMTSTLRISTMIFTILIGAALFALVFRGFGGDHYIEAFLASLPGGVTGALILVMLVMFVLGFFLDFIEIIFVVVPIVAPVLLAMGVDPVWLGILMAINLQTSFLTPPFGFALFYLRGVAPPEIKTSDIYRGALPFVIIQLIGLIAIASFPQLATWLPGVLG